jgi:hypothetical protein
MVEDFNSSVNTFKANSETLRTHLASLHSLTSSSMNFFSTLQSCLSVLPRLQFAQLLTHAEQVFALLHNHAISTNSNLISAIRQRVETTERKVQDAAAPRGTVYSDQTLQAFVAQRDSVRHRAALSLRDMIVADEKVCDRFVFREMFS